MSDSGKVLSALLLGAAAGAVVGLLMAPDKGSNTRKKIREGTSDLIDQLTDKINEGKEALSDLKDKAMKTGADLKDKAMSKAEQMKADGEEEFNSMKHKVKQTANNYYALKKR